VCETYGFTVGGKARLMLANITPGNKPIMLVELDDDDVQFLMQIMASGVGNQRIELWRKMVKARMELGLLINSLTRDLGGNRA
jgi:hypothetical protein